MNSTDALLKSPPKAPYRDVRALRRGLVLIEVLSKLGWARPGELSKEARLDRSSIYRLLETLTATGYVVRREEDGAFALTDKVRNIGDGIRRDEFFIEQAQAHMSALTGRIQWPSDLALLTGGQVVIQGSTHRLSPITFHRATIRQKRSLTGSALGRAIMMQMSAAELDVLLEIAKADDVEDAQNMPSRKSIEDLLEGFREAGYAWAAGAVDPNVSAIALGFRGAGQIIGAVNIVFFRRVVSPSEAANRYLPEMQECIRQITAALDNLPAPPVARASE